MLKKIIISLNQRKVKIFLVFLLCSFMAWSISKLSESYESRATFLLEYRKFPDSLLLKTKGKEYTVVKLRASGFQFLRYKISPKKINVDLQKVNSINGDFFLTKTDVIPQLERQFSNTVSVLELEKDTFFINLYKIASKKVPIKPNITIELAPNHILDSKLKISPKMATIKGPAKEIARINTILTSPLVLEELSANFSEELLLIAPSEVKNTILLEKKVQVSGDIVEFSEREFNVSINNINVPVGYQLKTFPNKVNLVCKATVGELKVMRVSDFELAVDYASLKNANAKNLAISITKKPENIFSIELMENHVEFILEKL